MSTSLDEFGPPLVHDLYALRGRKIIEAFHEKLDHGIIPTFLPEDQRDEFVPKPVGILGAGQSLSFTVPLPDVFNLHRSWGTVYSINSR